jgi:uncharacterized protein (TIGR03437 family)
MAALGGASQSVTISLTAVMGAASFVQADTVTKGNWKSVYGSDGYNVIQDSTSYPTYVAATLWGNSAFTWLSSTSDPRALQKGSAPADRIAACWFAPDSFSIDLSFKDANTHQVALYLLDWDSYGGGRTERVDILDGTGKVLDTRSVSGFSNGLYLLWNLSGHVVVRIVNTNASSNAVLSGLFFGGTGSTGAGTVSFVQADTVTKGNWKSVYGGEGYNVIQDSTSYPAYVTVTPSNNGSYVWLSSTTDPRAPQKGSAPSDRIAACWFAPDYFSIDLSFKDANTHQVALYLLDWDSMGGGRTERVDILDGTGKVLDTRSVSGFSNGLYLVWNLSGHVVVRIVNTNASSNAVLSGLFFGAGSAISITEAPPAVSLTPKLAQFKASTSAAGSNVALASLTCLPRSIRAGQRARCELQLNSVSATDAVEVALSSSSEDLKLPAAVTTRPGQSSVGFEVVADPATKDQAARINTRYGANNMEQDLELSAQTAPVLTAPKRQLAKFGEVVRFAVTASDSSGSVSLTASGLPTGASWDVSTGEFVWRPDESQTGQHEVKFTAINSANISTTERVRIDVGSGKPVLSAVVNTATNSPDAACSPGSVASFLGKWLSDGTRVVNPSGSSSELAGTRIYVNGTPAPVLYADSTRVNFLCPQFGAGTVLEAVVETEAGRSEAVRTIVQQLSPGIFSLDGSGHGQGLVSLHGTTELATVRDFRNAGQPAQPGDYLSIRATGLGTLDELSAGKPLVKIGGIPVQADTIDKVVGIAGVFDIRVKLPEGVPTGSDVPLTLEFPGRDGGVSNTVSIAIEPVRP